MSGNLQLPRRAATLAALSNVYRSLFIEPDSPAVQSYIRVLEQTQLVAYQKSAPCQALRGRARQCTLLLPGSQRVKAYVETDHTDQEDHPEEHLSLCVKPENEDGRVWVAVRSEDASGFNLGQEPEYEDHSEHLQSHSGESLLREIMERAGLSAHGHPLGLLAILFVCFQDQEVLEVLDHWPEFDEGMDTGDTMKMGWPETVAQALHLAHDSDSDE